MAVEGEDTDRECLRNVQKGRLEHLNLAVGGVVLVFAVQLWGLHRDDHSHVQQRNDGHRCDKPQDRSVALNGKRRTEQGCDDDGPASVGEEEAGGEERAHLREEVRDEDEVAHTRTIAVDDEQEIQYRPCPGPAAMREERCVGVRARLDAHPHELVDAEIGDEGADKEQQYTEAEAAKLQHVAHGQHAAAKRRGRQRQCGVPDAIDSQCSDGTLKQ
mmetsp:Transcript_26429/g.87657  ORF Transcript_26429/g.87657 Transcript_26429/m.87657 type:complete len:216 (+) Transcript_26429:834-1481(+)